MSLPPVAFSFSNAAFEPGALLVSKFTGKEGLSRLFRFDIDLGSVQIDVPFEDLINKPATLTLSEGNTPIAVHGIVADFEQRGFRENEAMYRAVLVPRAWKLTLSFQSRIFQQMTIPEVIEQVLKDGGLPTNAFRMDLNGTYPTREYIAQHQETDWNFISRCMEHLGIYYYFKHEQRGDILIITDHGGENPSVQLPDIVYRPDSGSLVDSEGVPTLHAISLRERVGTGDVVLKDYNYRTPSDDLKVEATANQSMPGTRYEYGSHYLKESEGKALAKIRGEELAAGRRVLSGSSNIVSFRPGYSYKLELDAAYRSDLNVSWLLTHVDHYGSQRSGLTTATGLEGATYSNTFSSIPASTPYRPARLTPIPKPSLMTAVTESAGGDYAHLDEDGRYRAKLHADLSDKTNGDASLPIRMTQPYSGKDYGIHFPIHKEAELVLAFINGDPDRPIAIGTAPNPNQKSPTRSGNKAQNVIRTQGGAELVIDDTKDKKKVHLKTEGGHILTLDDTKDEGQVHLKTTAGHFLLLDDKEGELKAHLKTSKGHLLEVDDEKNTIMVQTSDKNQTLTVNMDSSTITLENKTGNIEIKAPTGTVSIESKEFDVKTTADTKIDAMNLKMNAKVGLEQAGATIKSEAKGPNDVKGALVTVQASGINTIKGSMVMIN